MRVSRRGKEHATGRKLSARRGPVQSRMWLWHRLDFAVVHPVGAPEAWRCIMAGAVERESVIRISRVLEWLVPTVGGAVHVAISDGQNAEISGQLMVPLDIQADTN